MRLPCVCFNTTTVTAVTSGTCIHSILLDLTTLLWLGDGLLVKAVKS